VRFNFLKALCSLSFGVFHPDSGSSIFRCVCPERGTPIPLLQQTMGHADISTTAGYIHIRPGDSSALHLPRV
ncbi:MAG: hypothetical protein ACYTXL_32725, partial [Nostoc sp.]